jgi:hypothetical protein
MAAAGAVRLPVEISNTNGGYSATSKNYLSE